MLNGRRQPSCGGTSRISREAYVRFCEGLGVKFPGPTRQTRPFGRCRAAVASMSEIIGANEQVFGGGLFVGYAGTLNHQFLRRPSFCLARTQLITVSSYTMLASTLTTAIATMFMTAPLPGEGPSHC